jgi:transcriptional regulator with XRE-family HTH domain
MARLTALKMEILRRRLIQADLAEDIGISESRLSRIVNGRVKPRDYELKNLTKALGIEREALQVQA